MVRFNAWFIQRDAVEKGPVSLMNLGRPTERHVMR